MWPASHSSLAGPARCTVRDTVSPAGEAALNHASSPSRP